MELTVPDVAVLLREEADRRIEGRLRVLPGGAEAVSCRAGCAACCRQLVAVSPLEAYSLAEYLEARPELARETAVGLEAWERAVTARPALREGLARFESAEGYLPDREGAALERDYWEAQLPCPFLREGRCAVYPIRPFACREHHVISDPGLCALDPDRVTTAGTRLEFRAVASWTGEACFGLADRLLLLPRALRAAREEPEAAGRTASEAEVRAAVEEAQRRVRTALARLLLAARGGSSG